MECIEISVDKSNITGYNGFAVIAGDAGQSCIFWEISQQFGSNRGTHMVV